MANFDSMLSEQAKALIGKTKEATVVKTAVMTDDIQETQTPVAKAVVVAAPGFKMIIDSPKDLWDAVGHVHFEFVVTGYEEAMEKIGDCVGVWAAIKEDFAEEFAKADAMTDKQAALLKRLLNVEELSGADASLNKVEASHKIEELMKEQPKVSTPAPAPSGDRFQRKPSGGYQKPAPSGGGKTGGVSEATIKYATQIAERKRIALPGDFVMWSQADASAWIQSNK